MLYVEDSRVNWKSGIMVEFVRLQNDLSPVEFGEKFDVSQTELHAIESGDILPRTSLISRIAAATKLSFDQMCGIQKSTREEALFC